MTAKEPKAGVRARNIYFGWLSQSCVRLLSLEPDHVDQGRGRRADWQKKNLIGHAAGRNQPQDEEWM